MFKLTSVDLGEVKVGQQQIVEFPYEGIEIISFTTSCGCGVGHDKGDRIRIVYTPQPIPEHLLNSGQFQYQTAKTVAVDFKNPDRPGTQEAVTLVFKAIVKAL